MRARTESSDLKVRNRIFTKRYLLQVEKSEEEGAANGEDPQMSVRSFQRIGTGKGRKFESLRSLARRFGNF